MNKKFIKIYAGFLGKFLGLESPLSVVCDSSNGPAGLILKEIKSKKLKMHLINQNINGNFKSHGPDPLRAGAIDDLKKAVLGSKADLGVIFDADGDRAFFVDDSGKALYPDEAVFILTKNFPRPIAIEPRIGFLIRNSGVKYLESKVGHFFFKNLMRKEKVAFGAEISGHYYFRFSIHKKFAYYDSGIFAAIQMINQVSALKKSGRSLSDFLKILPKYYRSGELNFIRKSGFQKNTLKKLEKNIKKIEKPENISRLDGLRMEFASPEGKWWLSLRASNTESLLRLNFEATSEQLLNERKETIIKLLKKSRII